MGVKDFYDIYIFFLISDVSSGVGIKIIIFSALIPGKKKHKKERIGKGKYFN